MEYGTSREKDFTPTGMKLEGVWENDRNQDYHELYKDIIKEVYGVRDVIVGHHLVYQTEEKREDGFTYQVVQEVPSADTLIFDHEVAEKLWGANFLTILATLAMCPPSKRDDKLCELYYGRTK